MTQEDSVALAGMGVAYGMLRGMVEGLVASRAMDADTTGRVVDVAAHTDSVWEAAVGLLGSEREEAMR